MTNDEAIKILQGIDRLIGDDFYSDTIDEAIELAIEALECESSKDGTLKVKVEDATKVGRILVSDDKHRGGLYYPDEDESQSKIIVHVDRPKGKWNDIGGVIRWGCSLCHYAYDQKFNFCPNCGADMRGENE